MKKLLALAIGILMILSFGACKKKEEKLPKITPPPIQAPVLPQMKAEPETPATQPQIPGHGAGVRTEANVVITDAVKGKWSKVKILIEDKTANKTRELALDLHRETKIPDSGLKIAVSDFLPDFKMNGTITSPTNELNNPAVKITVYEGEKEIFKGWLFSKFPDVHPFEHPKYSITLKEGVRKG